ncbi:MAG: hypothetical protein IPM18_10675 [Phycisphaerales bacterium]|nr:hypothetical protein [Phycisphaerales bacterium]
MPRTTSQALAGKTPYTHLTLPCGAELAVDPLPGRNTVALFFRVLVGSSDDPVGTEGLAYVVERTLSRGRGRTTGAGSQMHLIESVHSGVPPRGGSRPTCAYFVFPSSSAR